MQTSSQNKKIKALSSSVVELQTQVKDLQKLSNNNVSFGTQQSLDALIHQMESEIDNQDNSEHTEHTEQLENSQDLSGQSPNQLENNELYTELENELTQELNSGSSDMFVEESDTDADAVNAADSADDADAVNAADSAVNADAVNTDADVNTKSLEGSGPVEVELLDEEESEESESESEEEVNVASTDVDVDVNVAVVEDDSEESEESDEESGVGFMEEDVDELQTEVQDDFMKKVHDFYLLKTQTELKNLCRKYKKPLSGTKEVLVSRILQIDKLRNVTLK
jgi:hypothetical protein